MMMDFFGNDKKRTLPPQTTINLQTMTGGNQARNQFFSKTTTNP